MKKICKIDIKINKNFIVFLWFIKYYKAYNILYNN